MRRAALLALVLVAAACGRGSDEPTAGTLRQDGAGIEPIGDANFRAAIEPVRTYSGIDEARRLVIRDRATWAAVWERATSRLSPRPALPAVDFSQDMIVFASLGQRRSGGYAISIDRMETAGGKLLVDVTSASPAPECAVTDALTSPLDAVLVPRSDLPAQFRESAVTLDCR